MIFNGLAIWREIASVAVEIGLAYVEGIETEMPGNGIDDALDGENALRATKTAKRRVGNRVGFDAPGVYPVCRQEIGVVGMKHRAVDHACADVRGASAAGGELEVHAIDTSFGTKADGPVDTKIMPLAGHHHVGVAVEPKLARPSRHLRGERGNDRPLRGLGFLAAKAAAHAPDLACHIGVCDPKHTSHRMLDLRRV